MIQFQFTSDRPIYIQLVEQLKLYIISGKIPPGSKLPSVRDLALQARVNPNTMQRALTELEDLRLIYTERTNGKYVTDNIRLIAKFRARLAETKTADFLQNMLDLGLTPPEIINYIKELS